MWLVKTRCEDWLYVSNHVSIQDSEIVGPHSRQFPLGGERTQQSVFSHHAFLKPLLLIYYYFGYIISSAI